MQMPSGVGQPADLLNRFLARLIDYVLLAIVNAIVVTVVVVGTIMGSSAGAYGIGGSGNFAPRAISALLTAIIALAYFSLMEANTGQTLGKMALKLRTYGVGGGKPTLGEAIRRNAFTAFGIIGIIPVVGGWIGALASLVAVVMIAVTINNSPIREGWHDKFAGGTKVIKVG
jgi:uncharacterized RDD family membrane protein YckC